MVQNLPCCWRLGEGIFEEDQRIWTEDDYLCCQTKPFSLVVRSTSFPVLYFKRTSLRVVEGIGGRGRSKRTLRAADFHIEDLFCQSTKTFTLRLYSLKVHRLFTQRKNKNFHIEAHKKVQKHSHWGSILWKNKRISLMSSHKSPKTFTIRLSHNGKNKSEWAFFKSREWVLSGHAISSCWAHQFFCRQKLDFFQVPKHQDFELV